MQEKGFTHKKEIESAQDRYQDMVANNDKQIRELRAQVNLKGKDISNLREEVGDLEARLG